MLSRKKQESISNAWVFNACVRLGLFDEVWRVQCTWRAWSSSDIDAEQPLAGDYALWILGESDRPPPTPAAIWYPSVAFWIIGRRAETNPEPLEVLTRLAGEREHPYRALAVGALGGPASKDHPEAVELLCSVASDPADPHRTTAIRALREAAKSEDGLALDLLLAIMGDQSDPGRGEAINAFHVPQGVRHPEALRLLLSAARDRNDPNRSEAVGALVFACAENAEILELFASIFDDPEDPDRGAVWPSISRAAIVGQTRAKEVIKAVAGRPGDRLADLAASFGQFVGGTPGHGVEEEPRAARVISL